MPDCPIVDSHVHFWDPKLIRYPWLDAKPELNIPWLPADLAASRAGIDIEAMVFVQCEADFNAFEDEAHWASGLAADSEPLIGGIVAWAPLENGRAVTDDLARLSKLKLLRGIRRIIQFEADPDFCLQPSFVEGVRALHDFGLSFDICVDYRQLANVIRFIDRVPDVKMVLDHIGKPAIADGIRQPWEEQIRKLADFPNLFCKISGVATEAKHHDWSPSLLKSYIMTAIEAFGFKRTMFGSDWPVATQAIQFRQWTMLMDDMLAGVARADLDRFWRGNARSFYRLN